MLLPSAFLSLAQRGPARRALNSFLGKGIIEEFVQLNLKETLVILPRRRACCFASVLAGALVTSTAFAQVSAVRSGSVEVGPFVGLSYGVGAFHVLGGGNITYAFKNKYVLPYFEFSYFPGLPYSYRDSSGTRYDYSIGAADFHGGVHVRIQIKESPIVPYVVLGFGALHDYEGHGAQFPVGHSPSPDTFPAGTSFAVNGGGGVRYYMSASGRFGLRVEAKVYKAESGPFSNGTIGKVEAGFFFQPH